MSVSVSGRLPTVPVSSATGSIYYVCQMRGRPRYSGLRQ